MREKLIELLCKAHGMATDASLFEDASYAQQLEAEADHLIANGVTIQSWIPVTERLPENGKMALCKTAYFYEVLQWDNRMKRWCGAFNCHGKEYVTHWMPLPEPPSGERRTDA